ncbi:MAG: hypothetical protein QGD94_00090 [Planctomycetia bacterium]|nr:hypothetical protein [Planctomycetia bacterium]
MRRYGLIPLVFASLSALLLAVPHPCGAGGKDAENKLPVMYQMRIKLPEIIRKDLTRRVLKLARQTYPKVNAEQVRVDMEKLLMPETYNVRIDASVGPSVFFPSGGKTNISVSMSFPRGQPLGIGTHDSFTARVVTTPDKPLSLDAAKAIANGAYARIVPDVTERARFSLTSAELWEAMGGYNFIWIDDRSGEKGGTRRTVNITVQKGNGIISQTGLMQLPAPKVSRKQMSETAAKSIKDFNEKHLWLDIHYYYSAQTLVWIYEVLPTKDGPARERSIWDATSGEILYSEILNGGTGKKPFRSDKFYFEPTAKAVKNILMKSIETRAKLLEQEVKKREKIIGE